MIVYNQKKDQLKITIPLSGIQELRDYQSGVLAVLRQVEIDDSNQKLMGHLMAVYKLLGHISLEEEFFFLKEKLKSDRKKPGIKHLKPKTKKS